MPKLVHLLGALAVALCALAAMAPSAFAAGASVSIGRATSVWTDSATLNATVNPNGATVTECYFTYGLVESPSEHRVGCSPMPGSGSAPVPVSASVSGLRETSLYDFAVHVVEAVGGEITSETNQLSTLPRPPQISQPFALPVSPTSAVLSAYVIPQGAEVTSCLFEVSHYETQRNVPCSTLPGSGNEEVEVSATVTGLTANTGYQLTFQATNALGTTESINELKPTFFKTPQELAYGTCRFEKGKNEYTERDCKTPSPKTKGKYEWYPGPAPSCKYVGKHGRYNAGCLTRDEKHGRPKGKYEKAPGPGYTSTTGSVTWEAPGLSGLQLACAAGSASGDVINGQTAHERISFAGCEAAGKACTSEGPDSTPSGQPGAITTNLLDADPSESAAHQVLTRLVSDEHKPYMLEADCEGLLLRISGSLAGVQAGNVNVMSTTSTTTFAPGEGVQALYMEVSESGGESWVGPSSTSEIGVAASTAASASEILSAG
ncbi:MAG: hypothetical protein ACRDJX_03840 [Solirubrobacteraceae bacterium]